MNINQNDFEDNPSYNFMNDDIDDDINFKIYISNASNSNSSSNNNSIIDSDEKQSQLSDDEQAAYKKLTYAEVEYSIKKHYYADNYNNQLDVLITYIKGQKHIYRQSYYLTQRKVALLITPCLFITGSIVIIAPIIQPYHWSGFLLSALNAVLTIFISILNFWNLQFYMMQYNVYSAHFDRLETSLILTRNRILLLDNYKTKTEMILNKIRDTETRMLEMKEDHPVYIPIEVKTQIPNISHIDIFAFMQKVEQHIKKLIIKYKDIKNEIRYIMYTWKVRDNIYFVNEHEYENNNEIDIYYNKDKKGKNEFQQTFYRSFINLEKNTITRKENERNRLMFLFNQKEIVKKQIVDNHEKYSYVDKIFTREIEIAEKNQNAFWFLCWYYFPFCSKTKQKYISLDNIFE
jgi:hypothetical protein